MTVTKNTVAGVPAILNLQLFRDRSFSRTILFTDSVTGLPLDFTNWTGQAQIQENLPPLSANLLGAFLVTLGGSQGSVKLTMTPAATLALNLEAGTSAYWDLVLIDPDGNLWPYLAGKVAISETVTRIS